MNADLVWKQALQDCGKDFHYESSPRNLKIRERLNYIYTVDMNEPIICNKARNLNYKFMFGEAAWILKGRNDLEYISNFMKSYAKYSDDGFTLNGAYGPKIMDQLSWAANELKEDNDSRRCYINIWRERPGKSKDIPCTTGMQFIIRQGRLNALVNMRSQDIVYGMTYDVFTFTMVAKALQLLLFSYYNLMVDMGELCVRAGSAHIYEPDYYKLDDWITNQEYDKTASTSLNSILSSTITVGSLADKLDKQGHAFGNN